MRLGVARARRPLTVALVVLAVYGGGTIAIAAKGDPIKQAVIGSRFLDQGRGASPAIDRLRGSESSALGYDGQFAAYIALDPRHAVSYLDTPAYRYSRILYPLVVRAAALGGSNAVPWALILVNVAAAVVLTLAAAALLEKYDCSGWYALVAGLTPGLALGLLDDLTEPLAYALAAVGALVLARRADRTGITTAALAFGLAGLARETALLFPLAAGLALAFGVWDGERGSRRRPAAGGALVAFSFAPALILRAVLAATVSGSVAPKGARPDLVPFRGLVSSTSSSHDWTQLLFVAVPALLGLVVAAAAVRRFEPGLIALALNVLALVVFLPRGSWDTYATSARITLGVPLSFLLCLPYVRGRQTRLAVALIPLVWWLPGWVSVVSDFSLAVSPR